MIELPYAYTYQVVRYLPDRVTGEFINVGVIVFSKEHGFLKARTTDKTCRLKALFPKVDTEPLLKDLKNFADFINDLGEQIKAGTNEIDYNNVYSVVPRDDSSIIYTEESGGIDRGLDIAFEDLFERLVDYYNEPVRA
ncbi:MAG: DUF3037 domain-containing protein [Bacteroidota bacterium]